MNRLSRSGGEFPTSTAYTRFVRRRQRVARFWSKVLFLATTVGILVLSALLVNILNDTLGYVAYETAVRPETLVAEQLHERLLAIATPVSATQNAATLERVHADGDALAVVDLSGYETAGEGLRALAIDGVLPSGTTIASGEYVLARPIVLYVTQEALASRPEVAAWVRVLRDHAQEVVGQLGSYVMSGDAHVPAAALLPPSVRRQPEVRGLRPVRVGFGDMAIRRLCANAGRDIALADRSAVSEWQSACDRNDVRLVDIELGWRGLALVVNAAHPVVGLRTDQLAALLLEARTWSEVDPTWRATPIRRFVAADAGDLEFLLGRAIGTDLSELGASDLLAILQRHLRPSRWRALTHQQDMAHAPVEQLLHLVSDEVMRPNVIATWSLYESLFKRDAIRRAVAGQPTANLVFRSWLNPRFLQAPQSARPLVAGIRTAILGSLWVTLIAFALAVPVGVGAGVYLEEYGSGNAFARLIETNINNLAGVPSIIYGMLGLGLFVRALEPLTSGAVFGYVDPTTANGRTVLSGGLTLGLLILPLVIINAREAVRAVPYEFREASYGVGATKWQTIRSHVLPNALPGILTGVILSVSRAFGETAPLIVVGVSTYVVVDPRSPFARYTTLPAQIYQWVSRPQREFVHLSAAAIIVLLALLLSLNATAIYLRNRYSRRY